LCVAAAELCLAFKAHKIKESAELRRTLEAGAKLKDRQGRAVRPLSPAMIRKLTACLTTILDEAVDDGHLERNPARSRRMRVKVPKPARTFLEMDELVALTDAAGEQDAQLARPKLPAKPAPGSTAARVAERWLAGKRAFEIADELGLARATVTYHLRRRQAETPGYYIGRRPIVATLGGSSRWPMPSEKTPAARSATSSRPTMPSTSSTRRSGIAVVAASARR
jgi:hypothetical protein